MVLAKLKEVRRMLEKPFNSCQVNSLERRANDQ